MSSPQPSVIIPTPFSPLSSTPAVRPSAEAITGVGLMQLHQMIFIYNAVMAGWSVRHIPSTGNFRFKKRVETPAQRRVYTSDSFLQRFVQNMHLLKADSASAPRVSLEQVEAFELPSDRDITLPRT